MHTLHRGPRPIARAADPLELLLQCHERMRGFIAIAQRLADAKDATADEVRDAATRVRRYFGVALPLHERDEEDSVAPRLRASAAKSDVEAALADMEAQHGESRRILGALEPMWSTLEGAPGRLRELSEDLASNAASLEALLTRHLALEESVIFPAVARALDDATRAGLLAEIEARRAR